MFSIFFLELPLTPNNVCMQTTKNEKSNVLKHFLLDIDRKKRKKKFILPIRAND